MVIVFPISRRYVKKVDAKNLLNLSRRTSGIGLILLSGVSFTAYLLIRNGVALNPLYVETQNPFVSPLMTTLLLLISVVRGIYLFFTQVDYTYANTILKNYKNNDLIETSKLVSIKDQLLMVLFVSIPIIYFVFSAILYTRN